MAEGREGREGDEKIAVTAAKPLRVSAKGRCVIPGGGEAAGKGIHEAPIKPRGADGFPSLASLSRERHGPVSQAMAVPTPSGALAAPRHSC